MSLSDYTKRNKAQRQESDSGVLSHRESSPALSAVSADLAPTKDREMAIVSVSPAPEQVLVGTAVATEKPMQPIAEEAHEEKKPDIVMDDALEEGEVSADPEPVSVAPVAPMADMGASASTTADISTITPSSTGPTIVATAPM